MNSHASNFSRLSQQSKAIFFAVTLSLVASSAREHTFANDDGITFGNSAAPLFQKHCSSCHNADDLEGGLALDSPKGIAAGGESGPALLPGDPKSSRMIRMMTGQLEPKMPPDDVEGPSQAELEKLIAWIEDGAVISADISLTPKKLTVPQIDSKVTFEPITDLIWSPNGKFLAVARYQTIEIHNAKNKQLLFVLEDHPGKINSIQFSPDSKSILAATGITGLYGVAIQWDLRTKKQTAQFKGHRDTLYSAVYSPDGKIVATAGYDHKISLWNLSDSKKLRELTGHNGAVYDMQFSKSGTVLASASGDQTVKLWQAKSGERLDTLGQPLKEQFVIAFHPTKDLIFAAGRDNRIRSWKFASKEKPAINPLLVARFAHEASIIAMTFSDDGKLLVTSAEDKTIKVWDGNSVEIIQSLPSQPSIAFGLDISADNVLAVGRLDGTIDYYALADAQKNLASGPADSSTAGTTKSKLVEDAGALKTAGEIEPNNSVSNAQILATPTVVSGAFHMDTKTKAAATSDVDFYKVTMKKGETWVIETNAARSKSLADTKIEVLTKDGKSIPRVLLQAVRDSYFTFRGKDASTSDDFRIFNWEEMELNEYLYCNGEVVRLFLYPRGPDSGFKVYPGFGARHNFYDTTPVAHALQEPCYVVREFPLGTPLVPNGLPVFELNYENDDDAKRKLGRDSKLFFTAPEDGEYLVKVCDARNFYGEKYSYALTIRPAKPDFQVSFSGKKMTVNKGGGKEFQLSATRIDDFSGPIEIQFKNVPPGLRIPEKIEIQANHFQAFGTIHAASDTAAPTAEQLKAIEIIAVAKINNKKVTKDLGKFTELKLAGPPKIELRVTDINRKLTEMEIDSLFAKDAKPFELHIAPGETVTARIVVKRNKHAGDIDLGKEASGRNLPHGTYVDNIGLNGLRIIKGQGDAREFFITAAKWVPEQTGTFHLKANNVDGETTLPIKLVVKKK